MATKKKNEWLGFYKQFQLHKACANDSYRPVMAYIQFKDGYAYATDAHIAVRANLSNISALDQEDIAKLNGYFIHSSQYELLLKFSHIEVGEGFIKLIGEDGISTTLDLKKDMKYPNVDAIINDDSEQKTLPAVGFNYGLLGRLKAAMGLTSKIVLRFKGNSAALHVSGEDSKFYDVRGIIMPMLVED